MYYVYCLKYKYGRRELYYGYTDNLRRRAKEHGRNWELIYYEEYLSESDARWRERKLKDYDQARSRLKQRIKDSVVSAG